MVRLLHFCFFTLKRDRESEEKREGEDSFTTI